MSNLSILQRNIIHALDDDAAETAFLRACDRVPVQAAERFAFEVRRVSRFLDRVLVAAARDHGAYPEVQADLKRFILERQWHRAYPAKGTLA